jgi:hypothetical protein
VPALPEVAEVGFGQWAIEVFWDPKTSQSSATYRDIAVPREVKVDEEKVS